MRVKTVQFMDEEKIKGLTYGLWGTVAMSAIMLIGVFSGVAPMPEPIPLALSELLISASAPINMILAVVLHFAYGGIAGIVFTKIFSPNIWKGFGFGAILWLIMQVVVLPVLGWGVFGTGVTFAIAIATLVLHLVYGGILGWGTSRRDTATTS